jgi:hypothetical protein
VKYIQYVIEKDSDGNAESLFRSCRDESGAWEEYLAYDGQWIRDNTLVSVFMNLHNPYYQEITEEEAAKIAESLGGSI